MSLEIIKKYNIWAKKSLGQNFLIDEDILESIALGIDVSGKNIIEVWPGYGALTQKLLLQKPKKLQLVELDSDMIGVLEERISNGELSVDDIDFQIHQEDILKFIPSSKEYSVIANIPYYITSPILRHFSYGVPYLPEKMLILMQRDVADKILGGKKNKTSVLRLFIEKKYTVSQKILVPKESFHPIPKVESSVLLFEKHNKFWDVDDEKFLEVIKAWFSEPRKKLIKNLVKWGYEKEKIIDFYKENNLWENVRGEDLSVEIWCEMVGKI